MPLTDDESAQVFSEVANDLRSKDLGWIVDEVEATISIGKVRTIRVNRRKKTLSRTAQLGLFQSTSHQPSNSESDERGTDELTADDYSPREKLQLLLESLIQYISDIDDLASSLANTQIRMKTNVDVRNIVFASEGGDTRIVISPDMARPHVSLASELRAILAQV